MDIFEDALQSTPPLAHSQESCAIVVDDDDNDGAEPLSQNNGGDGGNNEQICCPVGSQTRPAKRASPCKLPKLTAVPVEPAEGVICIYVGTGKKRKPVPMWPQYTVDWNGVDFGSIRFIVVGNFETWMLSVVATVTLYGSGQKARKVAKSSMERVRRE